MNSYQKIFYYGFILVNILNLSPFKTLAYFTPFIFIILMFLFTDDKYLIILRSIYFIIILVILFYAYYIIYDNFVFQNYLLSILTYSSFYPLLFIDNKKIADDYLLNKMLKVSLIVFTFEAVYGIIQAVYGFYVRGYFLGNSGDFVEGTIHPQLNTEASFSNPMFAVNLTMLLIAVLVYMKKYNRNVKINVMIGILTLFLASVIHVIIFLSIASFFSILLFYRKELSHLIFMKTKWRFSSFILIGTIVIAVIALIFDRKEQIIDLENQYLLNEVPRAIATNNFFDDIVPENKEAIFIGLGPGQFSSRASLIGSGKYLGGINNPRSVPLLKNKSNYFADQYIISLIEKTANIEYYGSSQQPFYSWLSIISEFGIVVFIAIIGFIFYLIRKLKIASGKSSNIRFLAALTSTGIIFLFLLGMQENYYEIPQAIFIGILLLQVMYGNVVYESNENKR